MRKVYSQYKWIYFKILLSFHAEQITKSNKLITIKPFLFFTLRNFSLFYRNSIVLNQLFIEVWKMLNEMILCRNKLKFRQHEAIGFL